MKLQKFDKINNVERLSKIIFLNFINLQYETDINFSIDDILMALSSTKLIGWFLLDDNNKIIGYIIGEFKELDDGRYVYYISYFYIIEKYRSKGLGFKMMLNCIEYIKSQNVPFIMLISDIRSSAFKLYQQLGFIADPIIQIKNPNYSVQLFYLN